ncbi:MAG: hypothetical protein IPL72_20085 [Sulfuritalea sp.]|nr:hypothetical protein [Sulfuritalea sp.]
MVLEAGVTEGRKNFVKLCIEGVRPNILQTPTIAGASTKLTVWRLKLFSRETVQER